jgi:CubicO group peptidase (beta-lactamase class C family)
MAPRMLAFITVLFLAGAVAVGLQGQVAPRAGEPDASIVGIINEMRRAERLPGIAVVVARSTGEPWVHVDGERRAGKGDPIAAADHMRLGSLTKGITATMIGALVEQKRMTMETTIGQTFPELSAKMQPGYSKVTVRQLLTHSSGVPTYTSLQLLRILLGLPGTGPEQRSAFVGGVLAQQPRFEAGTRQEYSNAGPSIAGAMAERITGTPYQQLVQDLIFAPLGGHAAFTNPGVETTPQPWGHIRPASGALVEVSPASRAYTVPFAIEPAGGMALTPHDYGRFLQLHLRGLKGRDDVLKAATIQELHKRVAMGWSVTQRDGVESHEHSGSYAVYVAFTTLQPGRDLAIGVFTNAGGDQALKDAVARLAFQIAARLSGAQ